MTTNNDSGDDAGGGRRPSLGLYLHVPFCASKCPYCDFLSFARTEPALREAYVGALIDEIRRRGRVYENVFCVDSVFFGGGTPSLLSAPELSRILTELSSAFSLSRDCEITMEANPGVLDERTLESARSAGVNRLSLGAQSLSDRLLAALGRIHTRADFLNNYEAARRAGIENINVDLMFAFPSQSFDDWRETLSEAVALRPEHISFYSLQLEEGTPMHAAARAGELDEVPEELDRDMYHCAVSALADAGYERYEISNAALPGFRCRHNLKYWSLAPYLGLGLGAHSHADGMRFSNTEDLNAYIAAAGDRALLVAQEHLNTPLDDIAEYMFLGLRRTEGVSEADYLARFGEDMRARFGKEIESLTDEGLLESAAGALRLTETGVDVSNRVFVAFV
jgi:oxygen-independent coproporphyrinogen-3 oxidase